MGIGSKVGAQWSWQSRCQCRKWHGLNEAQWGASPAYVLKRSQNRLCYGGCRGDEGGLCLSRELKLIRQIKYTSVC